MKALREFVRRIARGPRASALLRSCGIDPRRYWLLVDLFELLSERTEMMDQLGRNGVALQAAMWLYAALSLIAAVAFVVAQSTPGMYLTGFLGITAFVLTVILMSETGNSLVNPVEGLVLAHQPIDGATYTSAKLSHLLRIVVVLVAALNAVPAVLGLFLPLARWWYPLVHLAAALAAGMVAACCCCAFFGWLLRFVPVKRLKAAGQIAGTLPFFVSFGMQFVRNLFRKIEALHLPPLSPEARWGMVLFAAILCLAAVAFGLRSLSADYLIRVSLMMHAGRKAVPSARRRSLTGDLVARFCGGPGARAGLAYTGKMMLRDFQFRRQMLPMFVMLPIAFGPMLAEGWRLDPFGAHFSTMHLLPHVTGMFLFLMCSALGYGGDYKSTWVFLLAPDRSLASFARGVHALLWIRIVAIPHVLLLPLLIWSWGAPHAILFFAYSLSAASLYLALTLRVVDAIPFSKQFDPTNASMMLPLMVGGTLGMALAVGVQWLMFHLPIVVLAVTPLVAIAAWFLTRKSLEAYYISMRYNVGIVTTESAFYTEVA